MQPKSAQQRSRGPSNVLLIGAGLALGVIAAIGYAVWHAINRAGASGGWSSFAAAMLFPGVLVIIAVAAMVWLGWKANIDD